MIDDKIARLRKKRKKLKKLKVARGRSGKNFFWAVKSIERKLSLEKELTDWDLRCIYKSYREFTNATQAYNEYSLGDGAEAIEAKNAGASQKFSTETSHSTTVCSSTTGRNN